MINYPETVIPILHECVAKDICKTGKKLYTAYTLIGGFVMRLNIIPNILIVLFVVNVGVSHAQIKDQAILWTLNLGFQIN